MADPQTSREWTIRRSEKGEDGYFELRWSPFFKADKYRIATSTPALGGIVELYWRDRAGALNQFGLQRSWYGGIRSTVRERSDPALERDPRRLAILEAHKDEIYYRYSLTESSDDMDDVMYFLMETLFPGAHSVPHSGRYEHIWLREVEPEELLHK